MWIVSIKSKMISAVLGAAVLSSCTGGGEGFSFLSTTPSPSPSPPPVSTNMTVTCLPGSTSSGSPLVLTEGGASSTQVLSATVSGGTTPTVQWRIRPPAGSFTNIVGATNNVLNLTQTEAPAANGVYELQVLATDSLDGATATCTSNIFIKSNDAPAFAGTANPATNTSLTPIKFGTSAGKVFLAGTGVTDINTDTITYSWFIDGIQVYPSPYSDPRISVNSGNPLEATYDASAAVNGVGAHTLRLTISDSHETASLNWYISPNNFSNDCNDLDPGEICTLVGNPSIGDGLNPTLAAHLSRMRIKPRSVAKHVVGGVTNLAITDDGNHVVWYWNRTSSTLNYFGKRILPNTMRVVLGSGVASPSNAAGLVFASSPGKRNPTKINTPVGVAINNSTPSNPVMYVALYNNNRVVAISNDGITPFFTGSSANSVSATPTSRLVINASGAQCTNPYGLDYYATGDKLYVACLGNHSIRVVNSVSTLDTTTTSDMIVKSTAGNTANVDGTNSIGSAGAANTTNPRMLVVDQSTGDVFWTEGCGGSGTVGTPRRGGGVRAYSPSGLTYGAAPAISAGQIGQITGWSNRTTADCTQNAGSNSSTLTSRSQATAVFNTPIDLALAPNGLFVSDSNPRFVLYLNKNGSADTSTFGSWLAGGAPAQSTFRISGCEGNGSGGTCSNTANESVSTFNARNVEPYGLLYLANGLSTANSGGPVLVIFDHYQSRIREMSFSSGIVTTIAPVGSLGYSRFGQAQGGTPVSGSTSAGNVALYHPTGLAVDPTNNVLYISEYTNQRVTQVDLSSGLASNYVGDGSQLNESQTRANTAVRNVTNLVHTEVVSTFPNPKPTLPRTLLYYDTETTAGSSRACMVRAVQQASGSNNIFGTTLNSVDTIQSILGNYALGCGNSATATSSGDFTASAGNAINTQITQLVNQNAGLYRGMAIAVDASNNPVLYVTIPEKHCIVRVTGNGAAIPVVGTCSGTTGDGGSPNAENISPLSDQLNIPRGIAVDPLKPQNLFVLDQGGSSGTGKIKYINFSGSCVGPGAGCEGVGINNTYLGLNIGAGKIYTIKNINTTPYLNAIAVSATQICYTTGRIDTTNTGENNLVCLNRTSGSSTLYCGGDTGEYPNKDGAPLADTQLDDASWDGTQWIYSNSWGYQEKKSCGTNPATNLGDVLFSGPTGIAFDAQGNLYVADRQNHIVRMIKGGW